MYRTLGESIGESLIGGFAAFVVVTVVASPFLPAPWAFGIVAGLTFYGHMREEG